jgi:hypothetical protein
MLTQTELHSLLVPGLVTDKNQEDVGSLTMERMRKRTLKPSKPRLGASSKSLSTLPGTPFVSLERQRKPHVIPSTGLEINPRNLPTLNVTSMYLEVTPTVQRIRRVN